MIKSMTGFGRCEIGNKERKITIEIKSVNHRYLDLNIKIPKKLNLFEGMIRKQIKNNISRGKVDIYISYEDDSTNQITLKYNEDIAAEYVKNIKIMAEQFDIENDLKASVLSRYPEVLIMEEQTLNEQNWNDLLEQAVSSAMEQFIDSRILEGEHLRKDLLLKLDHMQKSVLMIEERSPQIITEYRNKLETKVQDLLKDNQIDENRLLTEVTIFADKICTDEEVVRLKSHIESTKKALSMDESIGRKLDFIAQEMNREANTILSKSNDLEISNIAIDLKTEIEKVREQIQNIE